MAVLLGRGARVEGRWLRLRLRSIGNLNDLVLHGACPELVERISLRCKGCVVFRIGFSFVELQFCQAEAMANRIF